MPSVNNALVGVVRAEATLDAGKFVDGAKRIQLVSKQTETQVKQSFSGIGAATKAGIAGFIGAVGVGLLTRGIKQALEYAASIKTVAAQLGVTTKFLQEFRYAAGQLGIKQAEADKGLEQFNLNLSKAASGSATAQKAFAAVGVSVDDIAKKSKPELFGQIADQMIKQGGAARNAAAGNVIFGEGFSKWVPLLDQGSKGINGLSQAADQLGIVLSEEQIRNADQTAAKLDSLQKVLGAEIAGVVTQNANSIYSLAKALGDLTSEIINFLGSNPQTALAIIGAIAGSRFGLPGAAAGVIGGIALGNRVQQVAADSNQDLRFRAQQVRNAKDALARARAAPDAGGRVLPGIGIQASAGGEKNVRAAINELNRQSALLVQATAAAGRAVGSATPLPQFLAHTPKGSHRRSGSGHAPRDRSDDVTAQFEREQQQADLEILRAKQQLAGSSEQRAALDLQIIKLEHDMQDAEINDRVRRAQRDAAEGKITQSALQQVETQAEVLKARNDEETQLKLRAFVEAQITEHEQDLQALTQQQLKFQIDNLHAADEAATTQADHRRIQLAILDAEYEARRLELENNKNLAIRNHATAEQIQLIQNQIDDLAVEKAHESAGIIRNTQSPLEAWARDVPKTAAEINEALQSIEVKGIDGLTEALQGVLSGTESLKSAFHNLAASILADLIQMTIKMLLFRAITAATGAFGGGGSLGASNGALDSIGAAGFATGGSITVGGRSGTDKNLLALNGMPIAKVSYGERINIDNGKGSGIISPVSVVLHNDFSGADPSAVAAIQARLDRMQAELPATIVGTMHDARERFLWRDK